MQIMIYHFSDISFYRIRENIVARNISVTTSGPHFKRELFPMVSQSANTANVLGVKLPQTFST